MACREGEKEIGMAIQQEVYPGFKIVGVKAIAI
jgi:hypothetical protein